MSIIPTVKPSTEPSLLTTVLTLTVGVMQGKYGTGEVRKKALGDSYEAVQDLINHIYCASADTLANEVIQGTFGTGDTRKTVLGSRYAEVQALANKKLGA